MHWEVISRIWDIKCHGDDDRWHRDCTVPSGDPIAPGPRFVGYILFVIYRNFHIMFLYHWRTSKWKITFWLKKNENCLLHTEQSIFTVRNSRVGGIELVSLGDANQIENQKWKSWSGIYAKHMFNFSGICSVYEINIFLGVFFDEFEEWWMDIAIFGKMFCAILWIVYYANYMYYKTWILCNVIVPCSIRVYSFYLYLLFQSKVSVFKNINFSK